jgi:hypothetical protein
MIIFTILIPDETEEPMEEGLYSLLVAPATLGASQSYAWDA